MTKTYSTPDMRPYQPVRDALRSAAWTHYIDMVVKNETDGYGVVREDKLSTMILDTDALIG